MDVPWNDVCCFWNPKWQVEIDTEINTTWSDVAPCLTSDRKYFDSSLKKHFFDHMRIVTLMQSKQCCIQDRIKMCHQSDNMSACECTERSCCCQSYPSLTIGTNQPHYGLMSRNTASSWPWLELPLQPTNYSYHSEQSGLPLGAELSDACTFLSSCCRFVQCCGPNNRPLYH